MDQATLKPRSGARKKQDVPFSVLEMLAAGETETVNLMEWLAADMGALARTLAKNDYCSPRLKSALVRAALEMADLGVTDRLRTAGSAIAGATDLGSAEFSVLAEHKCDLVRQWACYAVNDSSLSLSIVERIEATLPFAADRNMSVRETAWMAFRPHLAAHFETTLPLLVELAGHRDENVRRFAVEVTRPRSVWGAHLPILKKEPGRAIQLLERVKADPSKYVKLAAGNWLNDASKTRPDWVVAISKLWTAGAGSHTTFILRRGLRTIAKTCKQGGAAELPLAANDLAMVGVMEKAS